jgi:hypothetical protein
MPGNLLGVVTARWERNPQIPEPPRKPHLTSDRPAWWSWVLPRVQPPARRSAMPRRRKREPKDAGGKVKLAVASAGFRVAFLSCVFFSRHTAGSCGGRRLALCAVYVADRPRGMTPDAASERRWRRDASLPPIL